ncbi:hypothetical protein COO60DRAFT_706165 [Scenedesmus sp. NREL 46B-D3]|nr:hypothetical protein COO60DRAFT_706165 [Scenedesmus sp. NREL 46B-D3]
MPGRTESPSAQLGQLLLRGWTMLAEACEDCQLPLMRDPSTMLGHCVGCRKMYNAEGQVVQDGVVQPAVPGAAMNGPVPFAGDNSTSTPPSAGTAGNSTQGQGTPAAAAAAEPALQQQQQQQQQESQEPGFEEARLRYQQMRQQREAAAAAAAAAGGGSREPCQVLADRLLQGWTMLADHCPICTSPLMRSRAQEVRCVVCDLPVQMQGSTAAAAAAPAAAAAAGDAAEAATAATAAPLTNGPVSATAAVTAAEPSPVAQPQRQQLQHALPGQATMSSVGAGLLTGAEQQQVSAGAVPGLTSDTSNGSLLVQQQQVLNGLQHALLCKLDESRQLLLQTPAALPEQLGQHLQLAGQLLQALFALQQGMSQQQQQH